MIQPKVQHISGAVTGMGKKGDIFEVTLYDHPGISYFCKKGLGIKVGSGYKFGIIETKTKNRYEIVSVIQQTLKAPAFKIPPGSANAPRTVQMREADYKELVTAKNIRIRNFALEAAIKICEQSIVADNPQKFKREVLVIAKDLEPYFE